MELGDERPWNRRFSRRLRVSQGVPQAGSKVLASLSHTPTPRKYLSACVREARTGWDPGHVLWVVRRCDMRVALVRRLRTSCHYPPDRDPRHVVHSLPGTLSIVPSCAVG